MAELLATITSIFSSYIGMAGTVATTIVDNPLLLIGCVVTFIGLPIGLFMRLLRRR